MAELSDAMDWLLPVGAVGIVPLLAVAVAVATGGGWPRNWLRVGAGGVLLLAPVVVAAETGHLMLEMLASGFLSAVVLGYGFTRRGALRLALVGFALGSFGNVAVIVAMPFDDQALPITASTIPPDGYEAITASTRFRWLADIIPVPGVNGLASPGDALLTISMFAAIIAFSHSPDGRGGTGRQRSRRWYLTQFNTAVEIGDFEAAHSVAAAALHARPDDVRLRLNGQAVAMGEGDYQSVADDSLDALKDRSLSSWARGRFLRLLRRCAVDARRPRRPGRGREGAGRRGVVSAW